MSAKISLSEFSSMLRDKFPDRSSSDVDALYEKFKSLSLPEAEQALGRFFDPPALDFSKGDFIPHVKPSDYLIKSVPFAVPTISLDDTGILRLMLFQRVDKVGDVAIDAASVKEGMDPSLVFSRLADALRVVASKPSQMSYFEESEVVVAADSDQTVLSRLALPSFIDQLYVTLKCTPQDELIVVPFCKSKLFVGKSSSIVSVCSLASLADSTVKLPADHVLSAPIRVQKINPTEEPFELISRGESPVTWELYPFWGPPPAMVSLGPDGRLRYPVPGSDQAAETFLHSGASPVTIKSPGKIASESGKRFWHCNNCLSFKPLQLCVSCRKAEYCSVECQRMHWKLHKQVCKMIKDQREKSSA